MVYIQYLSGLLSEINFSWFRQLGGGGENDGWWCWWRTPHRSEEVSICASFCDTVSDFPSFQRIMFAGLVSHIRLEELCRPDQGSAHLPQNNTDNSPRCSLPAAAF